MSAHTPGPWTFEGDEIEAAAEVVNCQFVKVAPHRFVAVEGRTETEAIANAHLIAAAPELLEALIDVVAIAQLDKWDQAVSGRQSFLWNAKVAIAKAKGETQ